jgi:zinc-binding alcohol dehydrogenase/oxidoreductase
MLAAVLRGAHERVVVEEREDLSPGPGEAIVRVVAAALNHRDVWIRKGQYAGLKFPIVLGSDGAGVVERVGEGADQNWVGQEVIANPALGWGESEQFKADKTFRILGLPDDGTFAEQLRIPAGNLARKPDHLSFQEAACLPLAGLTAFRALASRAHLQKGERVLITGAGGGTAVFAIQFAVAMGARVFVTSGSQEKIESAKKLGAEGGTVYKEDDWDAQLARAAGGFDVIVDSAGGPGFSKLIDLANPGGRIVFFGATAGSPPELPSRKVFWKQLSLLGTTMGSPLDFAGMMRLVESHQIKPSIDSQFELAETNDALDRMEQHAQMGKIVINVSSPVR